MDMHKVTKVHFRGAEMCSGKHRTSFTDEVKERGMGAAYLGYLRRAPDVPTPP
ncbi:hypothetical protein JG687_00013604 [Phytophthora cactorum]|uniref:Uncharacterized protein n=1 Tax=Phytophthora cactorum TaxID=29920 RepID=A0A8T1TZW3_9STRA|nr:hypothetical protein JG687_00013604 [Phytophthora cactorum]